MGYKSGGDIIPDQKVRKHRTRAEADLALRFFLAKKFSEHHLSKQQIADGLTKFLGEPVTLSRLDAYTASTKASTRLPAYFLRALAEVLDSDEILLFLARPALQKQAEFAKAVGELCRICDELLAETAKPQHHPSAKQLKVREANG